MEHTRSLINLQITLMVHSEVTFIVIVTLEWSLPLAKLFFLLTLVILAVMNQ